ncbi:uncharacterized protein LOC101740864 [Bombyx mori]|uniref:uncharacterized protein LOC101740864 n=1 Tax=Bombyx mori TaxID=7091 RepID=UPI002ED63090
MFVWVSLLVGVIGASASQFHYEATPTRRVQEVCRICYEDDCFPIDRTPCEYFTQVDDVLEKYDAGGFGSGNEVDVALADVMESASTFDTDCIPLVSKYTDCTKENICTGCKSCTCDGRGQWNCSTRSRCKPDLKINVDRQVLLSVIDAMTNTVNMPRLKRSTDQSRDELNNTKSVYQEITEWLYGLSTDAEKNSSTANAKGLGDQNDLNDSVIFETTTSPGSLTTTKFTDDYLAFDYVLNSVAVDLANNNRRKVLEGHQEKDFNYMDFDDSTNVSEIVNKIEDNEVTTVTNKVIVDLLDFAKENQDFNVSRGFTNQINALDPIELDTYNPGFEKLNIIKRNPNENISLLTNNNDNKTYTVEELHNNVLKPLINIINEKSKELQDLITVKDSIQKFTKFDSNSDVNITSTNSTVSIYKLEIMDDLSTESYPRRSDKNKLENLLEKLKRDVYEVVRDFILIKKLNTKELPKQLKFLYTAMKRFISMEKSNKLNLKLTRKFINNSDLYLNFVKNVTNIFEMIIRNQSGLITLNNLSPGTFKLLSRLVNDYYVDDLAKLGITVDTPHYNLTNELQTVGFKWNRLAEDLQNSSIYDRNYALKLLHLAVMNDIAKMSDALALITFAGSRRMVPIDDRIGNDLIDNITQGLISINEKIKTVLKLHMKKPKNRIIKNNNKNNKSIKNIKKQSLMMKLKNILRTSKADIKKLLKKKVPKADIVKEIAKKRLHEMTRRRMEELEDTMRKWQSNLNIIPRDKRSAKKLKVKKRIKSIIPRYLRGKVDPALAKKSGNVKVKEEKIILNKQKSTR